MGEVRDSSSSAAAASRRARAATAPHDGGAPSGEGGGWAGGGGGGGVDGGSEGGGRAGSGGATKYSLAASAAGEYDPTFVRLNRTEHQVKYDRLCFCLFDSLCEEAGSERGKRNGIVRVVCVRFVVRRAKQ